MFLPLKLPAIDPSSFGVVRTMKAEMSVSAAPQMLSARKTMQIQMVMPPVFFARQSMQHGIGPNRSTQTGYVITYET